MADTTPKPIQSNQPTSNLLNNKYELGRLIGFGSFARVYHAKNLLTGETVAMKVVSKDKIIKAGMMDQVKREISIMKKVHHPNIVKLHEVMATKSKIYFAMEYLRGGELFEKVSQGRLKEDSARNFFKQLVCAVDFCHSRGVYHRDLKLENLLLDENGNLKVTDFGLSVFSENLKQDGLLHTACGTPVYVAPEVIGKRGYDGAKADLWSCGVILFVLLSGYLPCQSKNIISMYKKIYRADFKFPPWFSPETQMIVNGLLDPNPITRISASELMDTSWFKFNKTIPKNVKRMSESDGIESDDEKEKETLNAFHIISLSEGFDLSPLFGERKEEEMRFATAAAASRVIERMEEVGKAAEFSVRKSESKVRLVGNESGRKGKLAIEAETFAVTAALTVVEVKKGGGDTFEYNQFCSKELRPALTDIVWTADKSLTT
ncbi:CBL-interacting serine/threonine-protein kinase 6-like [Camellia sinensis]|uniref:non-specific serine/threonine protein kinase n=1 Tax=Camellia sinensis var. sinensis TaxID=542762 RepID=A0A4S4DX71_CAMSN|nr:CBL-interacting serine/threonine-protein kinase 6-like [Camellia sinensis]THG07981.1 hypothetical protein TEA_020052 [Camellia sinensis var. sinensis]